MLLCVCSNYFFIETNLLLTAIVFEIHKKKYENRYLLLTTRSKRTKKASRSTWWS